MPFDPLHDRVLVRRIDVEDTTTGGLGIPDTAKEQARTGEVVSVGAGARDNDGECVSIDVETGGRILFGKWSGSEIRLDGDDLLIVREGDILGIMS